MPVITKLRATAPWLTVALVSLSVNSPAAWAHSVGEHADSLWSLDPWVMVPLVMSVVWYCLGLARLWLRAGRGRGVGYWRVAAFALGMLALFLALVWPFEVLSGSSFAAHMVQHLLLIVIAPPLLVLAKPLPLYLAALPRSLRRPVIRGFRRRFRRSWRLVSRPGVTFALHSLTVWLWHAPGAFDAALASDAVHILEHACFLITAMLFWWSIVHPGLARGRGYGLSAFWALSTLMHSGFLGALLTFAPRPLYSEYMKLDNTGQLLWGMTALEDQQLAGVIMWVPTGLVYLTAGLVLVGFWLQGLEQNQRPLVHSGDKDMLAVSEQEPR